MTVSTLAQEIDVSARRFYEEMAEIAKRSDHPGVAGIFRMLAEDEESLFEYHRSLSAKEQECEVGMLDRGVNVFEELRHREEQLDVADDIAAYRLAIEAGRELLRRFRKAAEDESEAGSCELLAKIISKEARHLREIESLYDFANAPNHYLAWGEFSNLGDFRNYGRDLV